MFKTVIVGIGEQDSSRDAIALAQRLTDEDGQMTLAHVYWGRSRLWRGSGPADEIAERDHARELLEQVRSEARIDARLRVRESVSVGEGLHELAEAIRAELLVIGSPGDGLFGRVLVEESIREALNGAPCAIAFAPGGYAEQHPLMREIGVGYDGSAESTRALELARTLATRYGTALSALEVVSFPTRFARAHGAGHAARIEDAVRDARERIASLGGVEPHAVYGHPAEELALYSASLDLLIVGSRRYGPLGRLVHGSTSQKLARSARCPLLVLARAPAPTESAGATGNGRETAAGANV